MVTWGHRHNQPTLDGVLIGVLAGRLSSTLDLKDDGGGAAARRDKTRDTTKLRIMRCHDDIGPRTKEFSGVVHWLPPEVIKRVSFCNTRSFVEHYNLSNKPSSRWQNDDDARHRGWLASIGV